MLAFILAGVTFLVTLGILFFIALANGMSDSPSMQIPLWPTAVIGFGITGLLVWSHWWHISW